MYLIHLSNSKYMNMLNKRVELDGGFAYFIIALFWLDGLTRAVAYVFDVCIQQVCVCVCTRGLDTYNLQCAHLFHQSIAIHLENGLIGQDVNMQI